MYENLDKNIVYCNECLTPLKFNKKEKVYEFQCHCKDNKRFKYTLRWCENCKEFRQFYSNLEIAKCVFEANNNWRKENPELSRQMASNGGKALAKKIKNMTKEEKIEWTRRSCNSPTANKNPESKRLNSGLKYCEKCGKETYHMNNTCMRCHPSSGTGRKITSEKAKEMRSKVENPFDMRLLHEYISTEIECNKLCKNYENCAFKRINKKNKWGWCSLSPNIKSIPNFITKDNVRYYKDQELESLCERILNGFEDINNYPGFSIKFNRVCYHGKDVLNDEIIKLNNKNFIEKDILYYLDKSLPNGGNYIPWEDYKKKFDRKRLTIDIENFIFNLKSLDIFQPKNMGPIGSYDINDIIQLVPTFRIQDSETWEGARAAFEQNLVNLGIEWFVYIKFYIDKKGTIRPLVVGKSGSLLANSNGSDISFSTNINDGPARRFMTETETVWDKSRILIIKAKSEKQALYYEWKISKIFGLFES